MKDICMLFQSERRTSDNPLCAERHQEPFPRGTDPLFAKLRECSSKLRTHVSRGSEIDQDIGIFDRHTDAHAR